MGDLKTNPSIGMSVRATPATKQAAAISIRSGKHFTFSDPEIETLYVAEGQPVVIRVPQGTGQVILISDVYLASNVGLPEADNAILLLNLADFAKKGEEVIFDESGTRLLFGEPGVVSYARQVGVHLIFIELCVLCVIGLWFLGARVGPPIERRPPEPRAAADFVTGCAMLYERARMTRSVVRILCDSLRDEVRQCYSLRGPFEMSRAQAAMAADGNAWTRFEQLLHEGNRLLRQPYVKDSEIVDFSRSVQEFRNEVLWKRKHKARSGRRTRR